MTAAFIYARRSSEDDPTEPGVKTQLEHGRAFCADRGFTVVGEFSDSGISAWNGNHRPGFERLLGSLRQHRGGDVVVVTRALDRLSRSLSSWAAFTEAASKAGVSRVAFYGGGDVRIDDATGRFASNVVAATGVLYSDLVSANIKEGLRRRAHDGTPTGRPPFGYRAVGAGRARTFVVVVDEARWVRQMAKWVLAGVALHEIARRLDAAKFSTPGRVLAAKVKARKASFSGDEKPPEPKLVAAPRWRPQSIRSLLLNPVLAGRRVLNGDEIIKGKWEPILDAATFEAVRATLTAPERRNGGRGVATLLGGVAVCGKCGHALYTRWHQGRRLYACCSPDGCNGITIGGDALDAYATEAVLQRLENTPEAAALGHDAPTADQIADRQNQLKALNGRENELVAEFVTGGSSSFVKKAQQAINAERARLRAEIDELAKQLSGVVTPTGPTARDAWAAAELTTRRAIVDAVASALVVLPSPTGRKVQPSVRVRFGWE